MTDPTPGEPITGDETSAGTAAPPSDTKFATGLLITALALIVAAAVGGFALVKYTHSQKANDAERVLEEFLDAAIDGDPAWRDVAAPRLTNRFPVSAPFRGDDATAQALSFDLDYDIVGLEFSNLKPAQSHYALALVEFTYDFAIADDSHTTSFLQAVWVSRPFFYDGEQGAQAWKLGERPAKVGEWKVTWYGPPRPHQFTEDSPEEFSTTLMYTGKDDDEFDSCSDASRVLAEISDHARAENKFASSCLYRINRAEIGESVSLESVARGFPFVVHDHLLTAITRERAYLPEELLQINMKSRTGPLASPFLQFLISGEKSEYVITLALADADDESGYQIVSIQVVE